MLLELNSYLNVATIQYMLLEVNIERINSCEILRKLLRALVTKIIVIKKYKTTINVF